jgi:hypothetical protein
LNLFKRQVLIGVIEKLCFPASFGWLCSQLHLFRLIAEACQLSADIASPSEPRGGQADQAGTVGEAGLNIELFNAAF